MKKEIAGKIFQIIKKTDEIAVFLHRDPDADSLGSSLAIYFWLKNLGKKATVYSFSPVDKSFAFLPDFKKIIEVVSDKGKVIKTTIFPKEKVFIFPDIANLTMVRNDLDLTDKITIRIDHHPQNNWADINLVETKVSSVGELLVEFFKLLGQKFDQKISFCLLTAIVGDSLSFQTSSTTAKTLKAAAFLVDQGADLFQINQHLFDSFELSQLKLLAEILSQTKPDRQRQLVWLQIPTKEWQQLARAGRKAAFDFLVNNLKTLKQIKRYFLLSQIGKRKFRVSFRSADPKKDVQRWAQALGGGGHKNASGAIFSAKDFSQAQEKIFKAFDQVYPED